MCKFFVASPLVSKAAAMAESGTGGSSSISWSSDGAEGIERDGECHSGGGCCRHERSSRLLLQPHMLLLCRQNPFYDDDDRAPSSKGLLLCQTRTRPMIPQQHQQHKEWSSMLLMMKDLFAKLLLGDDFSGGSKGSSAALTISNAITKLSVAVFGNLPRLEPLSEENELKWRREMEWLVCPCDYIVELAPSRHSLQDGTTVEVMSSKPRADVYVGLPALQKLDGMLVEMLRSFSDTEFRYTERGAGLCDSDGGGAWLHAVEVPACGLSEKAKCHLNQERDSAHQILKAAKSINDHVLAEMEIPESYWQTLPKSGKKVMAENPSLRIVVASEGCCCLETLLSSLDSHSQKNLCNLASGLEALIQVWTMKIQNRLKQAISHPESISCGAATPAWAHVTSKDATQKKKLEKKRRYVQRARSLLTELRNRYPGRLQTALEVSKIKHNKDVGYGVLESYSRALVNVAARVEARIAEVMAAEGDVPLFIRMHLGYQEEEEQGLPQKP